MEVSYSSFRVKTETDSLLLGRWEKWKSRGSCGISKRSGKVLPLDFSAERLFPPPFYPRIVLETRKDLVPFFESSVGGYDHGLAFVTAIDDFIEDVGGLIVERQIRSEE